MLVGGRFCKTKNRRGKRSVWRAGCRPCLDDEARLYARCMSARKNCDVESTRNNSVAMRISGTMNKLAIDKSHYQFIVRNILHFVEYWQGKERSSKSTQIFHILHIKIFDSRFYWDACVDTVTFGILELVSYAGVHASGNFCLYSSVSNTYNIIFI